MGELSFWEKFVRKGLKPKSVEQVMAGHAQVQSAGKLNPTLSWFDLLMFGVGIIIGAGVFVLTGVAAREYAGPSVVVSYGIASLGAMLAALSYSEFAATIPISGSAYNYVGTVYGEFVGWLVAINLIAEYGLATSAIAKGFSGYFGSLFGFQEDALRYRVNDFIDLDILSPLIILLLCTVLAWGIKQSAVSQNCIAISNLVTVVIVLGASIPFFNSDNLSPFIPKEFGLQGIFRASSIVFFSYLGFDAVATAAEEVRNPKRDVPIGIVGSILVCAFLFMGMSLGIVGMRRFDLIDLHAPFTEAFKFHNMTALSTIIGIGALTGIVSSIQMCAYGMTRMVMVMGRERLFPESMAKINERTQTPVNATIATFIATSLPALLLDMSLLATMVSMGALFSMILVCCGVLTKTYRPSAYSVESPLYHNILLALVFLSALAEGILSGIGAPVYLMGVALGFWLLGTIGFCFLPRNKEQGKFSVPLKPFLPSLGILTLTHLICSLQMPAYIRFAVWQVLGVIVYLGYGMHRTVEHAGSEPLLATNAG